MVVERELGGTYASPYVMSAHTHAILVGFVMMMILGVALWLFPRPDKQDVRYQPRVAEIAYWLLTFGTAIRIVGELSRGAVTALPLRWLIVLASFAQIWESGFSSTRCGRGFALSAAERVRSEASASRRSPLSRGAPFVRARRSPRASKRCRSFSRC